MRIWGAKFSFLLGSIAWTHTAQEGIVMIRFKGEWTELNVCIASWSYLKVESVTKVPAMEHFLDAGLVTKVSDLARFCLRGACECTCQTDI